METAGEPERVHKVRCPACSTRYRIPADQITFVGAQIWCASCAHSWLVYADDPDESLADGAGDMSLALPPAIVEVSAGMQVPDSGVPAPTRQPPSVHGLRDIDATLSLERPSLPPAPAPSATPAAPGMEVRPWIAAALGLFLVVGLAGAALIAAGALRGDPAPEPAMEAPGRPIQVEREAPAAPPASAAPEAAPAPAPVRRARPAPAPPAPEPAAPPPAEPAPDGVPDRPEIGRRR